MHWAARIFKNVDVDRTAATRRSHLRGATGPVKKTWSEFVAATACKARLLSAFISAGLGLSGFGGIEQSKAEAGIVISGDPQADQRARDNGFRYSVEGGGNVGSIAISSNLGISYSSLVFVNPFTAILSAHQFSSTFGLTPSYSVGTGANYNSGVFYNPANVFIHPSYGGTAGSGIDLAVITFNIPVPLQNNLVFESGRPSLNETIWHSGFGRSGSPDIGYRLQDGFLRAGTSEASNFPPLLGGSPLFYQNTFFDDDPSVPNALRLAGGDSGGGTFSTRGGLYGINVGASTSISGSSSMFLNTSNPDVISFIDLHTVTAVPEPSSLLLLGLCVAGAGLVRRRRRFMTAIRTQVKDDSIASELPQITSGKFAKVVARKLGHGSAMMEAATRSWGQYFQEKSRELGIGAALAASAVGLSGFGEKQSEGGMILSLSQDAEYQTRGAARVIDNGGVQGWFAAEYDSFSGVGRSTLYSTAFAYTPSDIALHSHQIVPYLDRNPIFRFGTGSNYNTNRGTVFEINNVITVPGYVNGSSRASIQDLAVAHLAGQLNNFAAPVFATSRPVEGETLTFAGFGVLGTRDTGLIGQDGAIRFGVTLATDSQDPLGASPALYIETQTSLAGLIPFANAATRGDTGSPIYNDLYQIVGSYTHGSLNPSTGVAAGLDYTRPDAQSFLRDNQSFVTSVPEPSSLLMLAACALGAGFVRSRRRFIGDRSTREKRIWRSNHECKPLVPTMKQAKIPSASFTPRLLLTYCVGISKSTSRKPSNRSRNR